MKQMGFTYELQIFDVRLEDTGSYACCSEETLCSASVVVNGRMETVSLSLLTSLILLDLVL